MIEQTTHKSKNLSQARRRRGFIAIEWILVLTILVIGIVGGLSAVRNAILDELKDICQCIKVIEICPPEEEEEEPCDGSFGGFCCDTQP
jgi:Flp pilus assembly pilin Flp